MQRARPDLLVEHHIGVRVARVGQRGDEERQRGGCGLERKHLLDDGRHRAERALGDGGGAGC